MSCLVRTSKIPLRNVWRLAATKSRVRAYATEAQISKPSSYGQPLFPSHPHLGGLRVIDGGFRTSSYDHQTVKRDELTPGIPATEYERRRRELMDSLPDGSMVVSVAAPVKYMSGGMSPMDSLDISQPLMSHRNIVRLYG